MTQAVESLGLPPASGFVTQSTILHVLDSFLLQEQYRGDRGFYPCLHGEEVLKAVLGKAER